MSDRKEQPRLDGWVAWQDDPDPDSGVTIGIKDGYGYLNVAQEVPEYYVPLLLAAVRDKEATGLPPEVWYVAGLLKGECLKARGEF